MWRAAAAAILSMVLIVTAVVSIGAAEEAPGDTTQAADASYRPYGFTDPEKPQDGQTYFIRNKRSGKYMTTAGTQAGSVITQEAYTGLANQKWILDVHSGKVCSLLSAASSTPMAVSVTPPNDVNGTYVDLRSPQESEGADFTFTMNADKESYRFSSLGSHYTKVLAVEGASGANGARLIQYTYGTSNNDEWYFEAVTDDYSAFDPEHSATSFDGDIWYIKNKKSGMYLGLDEDGTNVAQTHFLSLENQKWKFVPQDDGTYKLVNQASGGQNVLAVEGASTANDANIKVQPDDDSSACKFKVERNPDGQSYRFLTKNTNYQKCVTVYRALINHGQNIIQYTYNAGDNDGWILEKDRPVMQIESGQGYYIKNRRSGLYLDTENGAAVSGTQIVQQTLDPNSLTQRWRIINTSEGIKIKSEASGGTELVLSVQNAADTNNASMVLNEYDAQNSGMQFKIIKNSDGYSYRLLTKNSNYKKCATVSYASYNAGASIIQYNYNDGFNDAWVLEPAMQTHVYYDNHYIMENVLTDGEYYIKNKNSGKYLYVYGSGDADGTNVVQWDYNGGASQRWKFVQEGNKYLIKSMVGNGDKCLYINPTTSNIELNTYYGSSRMLFQLGRNSDNTSYYIMNNNAPYVIAVDGAGTDSGDNVVYSASLHTPEGSWYLEKVTESTDSAIIESNAEKHVVDNLKFYWNELSEAVYDRSGIHLILSYEKVFSPVDECATGNDAHCPHEENHKEWGSVLSWISSYNQAKYPGTFAALHYGAPDAVYGRGGLGYVATGGNAFIINYSQSGGTDSIGVMAHEFTHNFGVFHHVDDLAGGEPYDGKWCCCQGGLPGVDVYTQKPHLWCDSCLRKLIFFGSRHAG